MAGILAGAIYAFLIIMVVVAHVTAPSTNAIMSACKGHGKVVSYSGTGTFTEDARVVCADGRVFKVQ